IIVGNEGQSFYKDSSECPGNLKWSTTGITIIGNGYGKRSDQLQYPEGLFIEPKKKILYVADASNNRIQKRYPSGEIKTAAGQANGAGGSTPNKLYSPGHVFADENENLFVADMMNQRIQYWEKDAKHGKTVAGNGSDGSALNEFNLADLDNERITRWASTYDPKTSAGTIIAGGNGAGLNPYQLNAPTGLYLDEPNNILYISNEESHSVTQWEMDTYGNRNIYAGIPGRPGNSPAQLMGPEGLTLDKYGNLYITDCMNHRIQMFCPNSVYGITIAGTGQIGNGNYDVIVQAQSGTGKTKTFILAVLQQLDVDCKDYQALILVPTRELAQRIHRVVLALGEYINVTCHACTGGVNVREDMKCLEANVQVVVSISGRIYDMLKRSALRSENIKMFIFDKADELLSRGFNEQIYDVFTMMPENVQVILLSITMLADVLEVATKFMNNPVKILFNREEQTLEDIRQFYVTALSIGRSGRFDRKGAAINVVTNNDRHILRDIEQFYNAQIQEMSLDSADLI
ncbi:unnamed protein product, partial [Rotaria sp. Silwood2]